ncbi:MAG: four helix bundle protein [Planctomycetes bacterium]|nr:four helix bundle protein [Planctomycetota bacterium]
MGTDQRQVKSQSGTTKEGGEKPREFDLEDRLINFAVRVSTVVEALPNTRAGNHVAGQLVRCGTSSPANYAEAQSAESRNDFIHKMKICLKELRETRVWLLIIQRKPLIKPPHKLGPLLTECNELIAIFVKSIATAQKNKGLRNVEHRTRNDE